MKFAVATDGSENALRATKYAVQMVKHLPNVSIEVIYVADTERATSERLHAQSIESLQLKRMQKVKPALQLIKENNLLVQSTVLKGNPSTTLIQYVNDNQFEGLFLGSRGLNTFQEMVLGSVSHKVMKHVRCPVIIVK